MKLLEKVTLTGALLTVAGGCADNQAKFATPDPVDMAFEDLLQTDADSVGPALRAQFETSVKPILQQFCGACHNGANGPAFLPAGADWYDTVTAWPGLVDTTDPRASRILTRGQHEGPAFSAFQLRTVTAWVEAEAAARTGWTAPPPDMGVVDAALPPDAADPLGAARAAARTAFDADVLPIMNAVCTACHVGGGAGQGFLTPNPDSYTTLLNWPGIIDLERPSRSRLITRGPHAGPGLTAEQHDKVLAWIELEVAARGLVIEQDPETPSFAPILGANSIDLTAIGLPGSTLTFTAELLAAGLYLSSIQVNAGPSGAHLVHPLFVVWKAGVPAPDPVDSFVSVDVTIQPNTTATLGNGTLVLVAFSAGDQLSVTFERADAVVGGGADAGVGGLDMGGLGGGCLSVGAFTQFAQPELAQFCTNCHAGGNGSATNALDMSRVGDLSPEGQAAACAQTRNRINIADPTNSSVFLTTAPASNTGHPFRFNGDAGRHDQFRSQLLLWIVQE